ncbi:UNVERIFIED_CONTAM: hypothetical protein Sradi_5045500 [Sesamum radiatum]
MAEHHQAAHALMENQLLRSDSGIGRPQEMPSPGLNSDEFPPIRNPLDRVNLAEPTRPPDSAQLNQNSARL